MAGSLPRLHSMSGLNEDFALSAQVPWEYGSDERTRREHRHHVGHSDYSHLVPGPSAYCLPRSMIFKKTDLRTCFPSPT